VAELVEKYGKDKISAELIAGGGGVFQVVVDGRQVFSKKEVGRFPAYGEVPMAIDQAMIST
jgi:selT/selW/selH-like putative selenoprotein